MDKATPTPSPASVDRQAALVAKLRYMGKQYAAGQAARGGAPQKHYLEEAADEIEMMAWALNMNEKTPGSAQENADLRNVIQAACIDGLPGLARAWAKYFPDKPITIKGAEVEHLAAQSAPQAQQAAREYPPLPPTLKCKPNEYCLAQHHVSLFTANQMRAYVDADRAAAQVEPVRMLTKEALTDLIAQHLSGTYHCLSVWEAWHVGTMSADDFQDVGESDTPAELADAIIAAGKRIPADGEVRE